MAPRTRVKICGITKLHDAEQAADEGAWAIGLIFWRGSKRRCRYEQAQAIGAALKRRVEICGVFVNATLDEIDRTVDACGLTMVQLHGDEGPSYCAEVGRRTGAKVIKAVRVENAPDVIALRPYHTDFHLLDTYVPGTPGGTGATFDWSLARVKRSAPGDRPPPLILSGGLDPDNVADAILAARPWAVDVASGTEASPGIKDPKLVSAFIKNAHKAERYVDSNPVVPTPAPDAAPTPTADTAPTAAPDAAPAADTASVDATPSSSSESTPTPPTRP